MAKTGETIVAKKAGNIDGKTKVGYKLINYKIENVLYIPDLKYNLLSVRKMEMAGLTIIFENSMARIKRGREVIEEAERSQKLYEVNIFFKGIYSTEDLVISAKTL